MDRPPYSRALELTAAAAAEWRELSALWALQGIDWKRWTAATWCDVLAELQARAAGAAAEGDSPAAGALAVERARLRDDPRPGTITEAEAARILAAG